MPQAIELHRKFIILYSHLQMGLISATGNSILLYPQSCLIIHSLQHPFLTTDTPHYSGLCSFLSEGDMFPSESQRWVNLVYLKQLIVERVIWSVGLLPGSHCSLFTEGGKAFRIWIDRGDRNWLAECAEAPAPRERETAILIQLDNTCNFSLWERLTELPRSNATAFGSQMFKSYK